MESVRSWTLGLAGAGLDGAVALGVDLVLYLEFEARVVGVVVAAAADLEDYTGIALVGPWMYSSPGYFWLLSDGLYR